jgi:uncharacterized protein
MNQQQKNVIEEFAQKELLGGRSHGWEHTQRVKDTAIKIGKKEGGDLEVLELAALLHDIARKDEEEDPGLCHAEEGARKAGKFLKEMNYPKTQQVVHCIESHRFASKKQPETLEARILQDADRLDAMGAIGIMRCFMHHGAHGSGSGGNSSKTRGALMHFYDKLLKLKDEMHTATAKQIAEERHEYMTEFLERLEKEEKGEI